MQVLIFGTFDHLHPGHIFVITEALKRARPPESTAGQKRDHVTVIVARDHNVTHIKGRAPDQHEEERVRVLRETFPQVTVTLGDPEDFLQPVRSIKPDLILLGYDQQLPPGVRENDFPCPIERITAYRPEEFKSSLRRKGSFTH